MDRVADFSHGDVVKIHTRRLAEFRRIAEGNIEKKRYRLCLHDSPNRDIHDMLVCMVKGDYARPHKHHDMPESHLIVEGRAAVILFSDEGEVEDIFYLCKDNGYLAYRVNSDIYHMVLLMSDYMVEHEIRPGPFSPTKNIFPDWAPDGSDKKLVDKFLALMEDKVNCYMRKHETEE